MGSGFTCRAHVITDQTGLWCERDRKRDYSFESTVSRTREALFPFKHHHTSLIDVISSRVHTIVAELSNRH